MLSLCGGRRVFKKIRLTQGKLAPYPAASPLYFTIGGILSMALFSLEKVPLGWAVALGIIWLLIGLLVFPAKWASVGWFGSALILSIVHLLAPWSTYKRALPGSASESYVDVEGVVTEAMLTGKESLHWLDPRGNIELTLRKIRLHESEPWKSCNGKILLYDKQTTFNYGQRLRIKGALRVPFDGTLPHQFSRRHYLKLKGIEHCLYPESITPLSSVDGWRVLPNQLFKLRAHLLSTLVKDVPDHSDQALLAAIMFGMKSGLEWSEKEHYRKSGMIHLFAVSGLHVGIIFSLIIFLLNLAQVPFRWRYGVVPVILLIYVGLTGAESSAVRAWLMLSVWSVSRSFYLPGKALNTVMVAALILLIANPLNLFHIGFQYSFLLVTAILCGWRLVALIWSCYSVPVKLVPSRAQGIQWWSYKLRQFAFTTSGAMAIFWLGGFGLTALYGHMVLPLSMVTNILVGFIAWGIMILGWAKIIIGTCFIPVLPNVIATILGGLLGILRRLAEVVGEPQWIMTIGSVPFILILAYYGVFFLFASSPCEVKPMCRRFILLAVLMGSIIVWNITLKQKSRIDILMEHSSNIPVICVRKNNRVTLINCGGKMFHYSLVAWLRGEGIDRVDTLILMDGAKEFSGSLSALNESLDLGRVYQMTGRRLRSKERAELNSYRYVGEGATVEFKGESRPLGHGRVLYELHGAEHCNLPVEISLLTSKYFGSTLHVNDHRYVLNYKNSDQYLDSFRSD